MARATRRRKKFRKKLERLTKRMNRRLQKKGLMYNGATRTNDETRGYRDEKQQMIGLVWNTRITTQYHTHAWCGDTAETTVPQTSRILAAT
jgi:hypothetical protein